MEAIALVVCFITLFVASGRSQFVFTVQGNITADGSEAPYSVNDDIHFNFSFRLQGEENVTGMIFKFTSETLMFLPVADRSLTDQISWLYDKAEATGSTVLQDRTSNLTFNEVYDDSDNSISVSFPFRGWASEDFYGQMTMVVRDTIGPGRKLNCKAVISYYLGAQFKFVSREIESTYTFSELPRLSLTLDYPVYLRVLETTTVRFSMDLPHGLTEGSVQMVMPISSSDSIPQMSLQDFRVKANQSIPSEEVSALSCTYDSQTLDGMNDLAIISPLDLMVNDTNSPGNELELDFDVQTEIYRGIENVSEIWIGGGMKFGNSFLWVAEIPVFLLDDYDRTVHLKHNVSYISEYGYDGEMFVTVEVTFGHEDFSTDHAYDVTLMVYMMPLMKSVTLVGSHLLGEHGSVQNTGRFIVTIGRVLLDTNPSVRLNISFDATDYRFGKSDTFIVITELFYYGGYVNSTEQASELQHIIFQMNIDSAKQLTFTDGATCACAFDPFRSDCGCCRPGGCQCGVVNPAKCSDCQKPWRCQPYITGFAQESHVDGEYVCRAYQLYRPMQSGVSCYREKPAGIWTNLNPAVGIIVGKDSLTGTLYGISNNGKGIVKSEDEGRTWASISTVIWEKATSEPNYVNATYTGY
ncbi:uncharacterized protein LOC135470913 [Liolophura sinensis]|uniref:uncharacterized protein LOC135470913 n=1 Tax=Liolophura sinensis TaxID=3198878 RepID=UPI0031589D09